MRLKISIVLLLSLLVTVAEARSTVLENRNAFSIDIQEAEVDSAKSKTKGYKKYFKLVGKLFKKAKAEKKKVSSPISKLDSAAKDTATISARSTDYKKYGKLLVDLESEWDSVHKLKPQVYQAASDSTHKVVFGFHPYWMGASYKGYNYDLLSAISYFSFELNPSNGKFRSTHHWKDTKVIDSAKAHHCKIYFTVSNFTQRNNVRFLSNEKAKEEAINGILEQLKLREANGVVIDFENIPKKVKSEYIQFIQDLSEALLAEGKTVSITLPAVDDAGVFDVDLLSNSVEYFLLMGYDYFGAWSKIAGPVAPLHSDPLWGSLNVENSIKNYLNKKIAPNKLILVVPYYGSSWKVKQAKLPSQKIKFVDHLLYREVMDKYPMSASMDSISQSAYFNISSSNHHHQVWFDNVESLSLKYDLVNKMDIGGAGIWALGYDNGYTELWSLLDQKFGNAYQIQQDEISPTAADTESPISLLLELIDEHSLIKQLLALIGIIVLLGILLSLLRKEIRDILLQKRLIILLVLLLGPSICLYIILKTAYFQEGILLLIGLLIGYGIYFLKDSTQIKPWKKIP